MKIIDDEIYCENQDKEFKIVKFIFKNNEDSYQINEFIKEGKILATKLNPVLARDGTRNRKFKTILTNAIAGIISEWVWRNWLNQKSKEENKHISFNKTKLEDIKNQIDIKVIFLDETSKDIEVRSSFPYTGIKNGVCKVFDIIGWYTNQIKIAEIKKDYYLRCLFPYKSYEFLDLLNVEFEVYLTGGATKEMLENSIHSKNKEFIPYDEINDENIKTTEYRVIEPIINALDTQEIKNIIFGAKR